MSLTDTPERRHVLDIKIHADDMESLRESLQEILCIVGTDWKDDGRVVGSLVNGGVRSGFSVLLKENPQMTHDNYVSAIKQRKLMHEQPG